MPPHMAREVPSRINLQDCMQVSCAKAHGMIGNTDVAINSPWTTGFDNAMVMWSFHNQIEDIAKGGMGWVCLQVA
jgi:hypothetical protein